MSEENLNESELREAAMVNIGNEALESEEKEVDLTLIDTGRILEIETDWDKYIIEKREDGFYLTDDAGRYPQPTKVNLGSFNPSENPQPIKPNIIRIDWFLTFDIDGRDVDYGEIKSVKFVN